MDKDTLDKVRKFNLEQLEHVRLVQQLLRFLTGDLELSAILHDASKFDEPEYAFFVDAVSSLRQSTTGKDSAYQKKWRSDAIQHHIHNNPHHAEYWDKRGEQMPVTEVIHMYFDWISRNIQKREQGKKDDFWEYNLAKLKNQPHAVAIVNALRHDYPPEQFELRDGVLHRLGNQ